MSAAPESPIPPPPSEPPGSFGVALLTLLAVVVGVEIFYRSSTLEKKVRKGNYITAKVDEYAAVQADVVVTGDSRMFHGVIPAVMSATLEERTGKPFHTFNFGVPSGTTPIFLMVAHEAVLHRPPPRAFVIGVTPALFSCCDAVSAVGTAPAARPSAIPSLVRATWWTYPEEAGASVVLGLFRVQAQRTEVLAALRDVTSPAPVSFVNMGWNSMGGRQAPETQNVRARGRAGAYAELMDKEKGAYLHAAPASYLRAAIAELKGAGVRVAVIGTPQARQLDSYHDAAHTYFEYLAAVKGVTSEMGVPFVDLNTFPGLENSDFVDGDHLCEDGARKFTRYLATEVVEPLLR
jgi:hypothetical protein